PGQTQTVLRTAHLEWRKVGKALTLFLSGPDGSGGMWQFEELVPDKYRLSFTYECTDKMAANYLAIAKDFQPGPGESFWLGKATTAAVEFEIAFVAKPVQDVGMVPIDKLIADFDSAVG